jgi:mRNA-degrading endonuclease YafQ of YafQ-DinJ toxin-antitoxin module
METLKPPKRGSVVLVIYRFLGDDEERFERMGSHADLFR